MSKTVPIIKIEPENELRFQGPFKEAKSAEMKLRNITEREVCFKVKTTAPKRYCVKPTTGVLKAMGEITILVSLQPFDPNDPNEKGKHKFQVLSMYAPDGEYNVDTLWKEASSDQIHDWKLKCVLEMPEEGKDGKEVKEVTASSTTSAALESNATETNPPAAESSASQKASDDKGKEDATAKLNKLRTELRMASEEIYNLREELSRTTKENIALKEEGLRLRRVAASGTGGEAGAGLKTAPPPLPHPSHAAEQTLLNQTQLIMLLIAVVLGVILGKIIF